ncbi:MAG: alpha/beta hydrolase [Anaerolineae bacterium]|nr:alpha/beta hydrolase [Anaerolineae bacterium]NUQ03265.1 alpha/beta hydrolase [Anaerolineae bacterium]
MDLTAQRLTLRDGRALGYAEWGDASGLPVFFFSGLNGARLFRHPDESIDRELGVHLYTFDRPGLGLSDPHPGRSLLTWAEDICDFINQKEIAGFCLMTVSLGGPYGAACAYRLPDRVRHLALVSSISPLDDTEVYAAQTLQGKSLIFMGRRIPWAFAGMMNLLRGSLIKPDALPFLPRTLGKIPPVDRKALDLDGMNLMLIADQIQALATSATGVAQDLHFAVTDWGFRVQDITTPTTIWQGDADIVFPPIMGETLHRRIARSTYYVVPGAGHLLILSQWQAILADIVATAARS